MNTRRLPFLTLALVAAALAIEAWPRASGWFVFARSSIQDGQLWRLLTGHLVHEVPGLALLDLVALLLLGTWVERRDRRVLGPVLLASAVSASCGVLLFSGYERYLGSSALTCGLFVAAGVLALRDGRRITALALGLLLAAKLTLEWIGLSPAGLSGLPPGFEPALSAHVGGALGGLVAFAVTGPGSRPRIRQSRPGSTSEEQSWSPSASTRFPSRSESPS